MGGPRVLVGVPQRLGLQQRRHHPVHRRLAHPWVATNWLVHWVITALVFLGALGMIAMFDLFDVSKLRERMMQPWKTISFPTKIALYFSTGLVVFGGWRTAPWNGTAPWRACRGLGNSPLRCSKA